MPGWLRHGSTPATLGTSPLGWSLFLLSLSLCMCRAEAPPSESAPSEIAAPPAPITVTKGQSNLLYTYRDPESGGFKTVENEDEVPAAARTAVVVTDLSVSPEARGAQRYVHVADLRRADGEGRYLVSVASRYSFESRRSTDGQDADIGPREAAVIVYSTGWCGACKKAKRVLGELGVPFVEKDIEASRSAREELEVKALRAGFRPGDVPVIDIQGQLLLGLNVPRLKAVLREAKLIRG